MPLREDAVVARGRLQWAAWATVAVVALSLTLPEVRTRPLLLVLNLVLLATAVPIAVLTRRGRIAGRLINVGGTVLAGQLAAVTLTAYVLDPQQLYVVMLLLQLVAAGALFFSAGWLLVHLAAVVLAAVITFAMVDAGGVGVLVATGAVLSLTLHVALRDRQRHRDGVYATQLEAALSLAREQLREREQAELARAQAQRDSERYQAQLLHAQKMEAIGTLAGGVAHDMNNALVAIMGVAECLASEAPTPAVRADAEQIVVAARRAADLTRNLLGFSRRGQYRSDRIAVGALVDSVVALLGRTLPKGVTVTTSLPTPVDGADALPPVMGDGSMLSHALVNLAINATDAMAGRGTLAITGRAVELDDVAAHPLELAAGPYVLLTVRDDGAGMDEATRARVFEPFFTTKAAGTGTGLGLAMVYGTIKRHQGAVTVDSAPGQGAMFSLYLPIVAGPVAVGAAAPAHPRPVAPSGRRGRVLVVDDEDLVRTVVVRALERAGHEVTVATDGKEGLARLRAEGGRFDLVLLDMAMPRMSGPEMFRAARALYPELRVLLTSGYASSQEAQAVLAAGAIGLLDKPFAPAHLVELVGAALVSAPTWGPPSGDLAIAEPATLPAS
ncbi:MAG: response regulator [Kofleriaceae bacterium]|nr:response regulator [Kofleriaceae bacterium]